MTTYEVAMELVNSHRKGLLPPVAPNPEDAPLRDAWGNILETRAAPNEKEPPQSPLAGTSGNIEDMGELMGNLTPEAMREIASKIMAKRAQAGLRAIVINPNDRTITEQRVASKPGDPEEGYGTQIDIDDVRWMIGCRFALFTASPLTQHSVVVDDEAPMAKSPPRYFWEWQGAGPIAGVRGGQPIADIGVLLGRDLETDTWSDVKMSLDEVRSIVRFTERV
jgi:hypothetical protein